MYSVPIKCETHGGFGKLHGMLLFDGRRLLLQYQTEDSVFGVLKSDPKQIEIALDSLVDARYSAGFLWLAPSLQLRVSDFNAIAQLPSIEGGRIKLRVGWSDRADARRLIDSLSALCAELRYATLNHEIDRMATTDPLARSREAVGVAIRSPASHRRSEGQSES